MESRIYETTVILDPQLDQNQIDGLSQKIESMIIAANGVLIKRDYWGKRRLAFEIKRKQYGFYVYLLYKADGNLITAIEREFKLNESVLRFLSAKLTKAELQVLAQTQEQEKKAAEVAPVVEPVVEENTKAVPSTE